MDFTIEELSMNAWPALQNLVYDGWIIRLSNGYGNRANSINPIYPSSVKLEEKLKYCDELFAHHNLPAAYKITGCGEQRIVNETLEKMGYKKINETSIQTCAIGGLALNRTPKCAYEGIVINDVFSNGWRESVIKYNRIAEKDVPAFHGILDNVAVEKIVVQKELGGKIVGCGYGAIERNYVGIFDIVVKEEFRGKGYGRAIVETLLFEASGRGVENSYLQVMLNNPAAMHLYEKIGYREIYRYWYMKKPAN